MMRLAAVVLTVAVATFAAQPVSAEQERIPVFVIGQDGGLSPFVIRRDSEEFEEVVFPAVAEAMARKGLRAIDEAPFRAKFEVDGIPGERLSRWSAEDFLHFAREVSIGDTGNSAPYMVTLNIWRLVCRDEANAVCVDIGAEVYDTASRERLVGRGSAVRIPIPPDCPRDCVRNLWPARAGAILHPLSVEIATLISQHRFENPTWTRVDAE